MQDEKQARTKRYGGAHAEYKAQVRNTIGNQRETSDRDKLRKVERKQALNAETEAHGL